MQCQQALELLSGHIDNTNTEEQEAMLQEHLSTCEHCRELLKAYEELDQGILANWKSSRLRLWPKTS